MCFLIWYSCTTILWYYRQLRLFQPGKYGKGNFHPHWIYSILYCQAIAQVFFFSSNGSVVVWCIHSGFQTHFSIVTICVNQTKVQNNLLRWEKCCVYLLLSSLLIVCFLYLPYLPYFFNVTQPRNVVLIQTSDKEKHSFSAGENRACITKYFRITPWNATEKIKQQKCKNAPLIFMSPNYINMFYLFFKEHGSVCRDVWWWIHRGWMSSSLPWWYHTQRPQHGAEHNLNYLHQYPVNSMNKKCCAADLQTSLFFSILATCKSLWCSQSSPASG